MDSFFNKINRFCFVLLVCWSLTLTPGTVFAQYPTEFQLVELIDGLKNSVNFEFAPDGRIFIIDRYGEIIIYKPDLQVTTSAGTIPVFHELEDGLLGIEFDPNFLSNNYVYLNYSPLSPSVNRVSRFTMNGDQIDLGSEVVLLEWATQREVCCHSAGDLAFDSQGNLYIAVGDNTTHSDYATYDETDSNKSSENTSSNTNDLRGKILRIKPQANGTYTIPNGNLFPGGAGGLPEIYVMGARNPYRIYVDKENNDWLYWGEVGPDADNDGPDGPKGLDEINLTKQAGNFGWPYFSGKNQAYRNTYSNPPFFYNPAAPVNISTWNTGATNLPPAEPALIEFFHNCLLAGPRYYYDPGLTDVKRLPVEFDERFFYFDFNSSRVWVVKLTASGAISNINQLAPEAFPVSKNGFIDMKVGPDDHLYILEYGEGCCPDNAGSGKLVRVDYTGISSNSSPVVEVSASPNNGSLPLSVDFSSEGTFDPDGDPVTYEWDFDTDGTVDSFDENPSFNYTNQGEFNAQLKVTDNQGGVSVKNVTIYAGNNAATYNFNSPVDGGFITWNQEILFDVSAVDVEDGAVSCAGVNLVPSLGHLNHFHDDLTIDACPKTMMMDPLDHDIHGEMDIYYVLGVNFTDQGGLTSFDQIRLYPKRTESEFYDEEQGVEVIPNTDPWGGGTSAITIQNDDYIVYTGRNLLNIEAVRYRTSAMSTGGSIEFRLDSLNGTLLATTQVPATGSVANWVDYETEFETPEGKHDLYFVFKQDSGAEFNLNWVEFMGSGVSSSSPAIAIENVEALAPIIVAVVFDQPIDEATAQRVENYTIDNNVQVSGAYLQPDQRTVYLEVSPLQVGTLYSIDVGGAFQSSFSYEGCGEVDFPVEWEEFLIDNALPYRSVYIFPHYDLDGDGFRDIVTGGWWYKNPGVISGNWAKSLIGAPLNNVAWVYDFDDDGDLDLFGSQGQYESADLAWAENDGSGNFTIHTNIPSGTTSYTEIFVAGVAGGVYQDGGPYQMAITWNGGEDGSSQVQMLTIPSDPVATTWTIENIHPTSLGEDLTAGDIDGDGDLDLFQTGNWLRNDNGSWTLFSTGITYTSTFDRNAMADFDLDGDLDGVAGQLLNNREIGWFEAPDDPTQPWTKHTIDPSIDGSLSVEVADMDFDGDMDIVVGEWKVAHLMFGFENDLNNSGTWIKHILDDGGPLDHHDGVQLADLDNDGDLDITTIGWDEIVPRIFENKSQASNCAPVIVNPGNQFYDINDDVQLQILASDTDSQGGLTYTASGLPPSLSIDSNTGLISGTVTTANGDYSVTVTVSDGSLSSEETFLIRIGTVTDLPDQPNVSNLKVYPNPTNDLDATLQFYLNSADELELQLYDMIGRLQISSTEQFGSGINEKVLDLSTVDDGVYYLRIISKSSNSKGIKIVVNR